MQPESASGAWQICSALWVGEEPGWNSSSPGFRYVKLIGKGGLRRNPAGDETGAGGARGWGGATKMMDNLEGDKMPPLYVWQSTRVPRVTSVILF